MSCIAAIATPPGVGALSVIRISGPQAHAVLQAATGRSAPLPPRMATLVHVRTATGEILDECMATCFYAPASFTGEDVAELTCHGGMLVTRRVLERLFACGARPAEPGEFSRRAFENGKIDLTAAEAIMDIINAGSDLALRAAQSQLSGAISRPVQAAIDALLTLAAHLEAYIDFPEEDISPQTTADMQETLSEVGTSLTQLVATADSGRLLREGVRTVIIGTPNAGKSSLLNRLLGFERAIVSPTPGTTRDTVEESFSAGGMLLRLIDTAGLRDSEDVLEQAGVERTRQALQSADLVLEVQDTTTPPSELPVNVPKNVPHLTILNKCDLPEHSSRRHQSGIRISALTGIGISELHQAIASLFATQSGEADTTAAINTRHLHALRSALSSLHAAATGLAEHALPELIAVDLRAALDALGTITGKVDTEDLLSRIFSSFCLGK